MMDSAVTLWVHFICSCSLRKCAHVQVVCNHAARLHHWSLQFVLLTADPSMTQTAFSSSRLRLHLKKQSDGNCTKPSPCCNPLHMQNWMQHMLWVLQIWTSMFVVMWWLQRTLLLKYHITRSWQMFSQAQYRYQYNNYITIIPFLLKWKRIISLGGMELKTASYTLIFQSLLFMKNIEEGIMIFVVQCYHYHSSKIFGMVSNIRILTCQSESLLLHQPG